MERSTELDESSAEGNKTTNKAEAQLINSKKRPITQSELDDKVMIKICIPLVKFIQYYFY